MRFNTWCGHIVSQRFYISDIDLSEVFKNLIEVQYKGPLTVAYPGGGGGFGCSNTPLSVQLINYSLLIRLTELLVHLAQAVPGCWSSTAAAGVPGSSKSDNS